MKGSVPGRRLFRREIFRVTLATGMSASLT